MHGLLVMAGLAFSTSINFLLFVLLFKTYAWFSLVSLFVLVKLWIRTFWSVVDVDLIHRYEKTFSSVSFSVFILIKCISLDG